MAQQDVVRALVPSDRVQDVEQMLVDDLGIEPAHIEAEVPEPGVYRDEQPDRELRHLVRVGRGRMIIGVLIGGTVGVLGALVLPLFVAAMRDLTVFLVPLFAFAGGWGGGVVAAARGVQEQRDTGDRPERLHRLGPSDVAGYRLLTVRELHERPAVADALADLGIVLLDTRHPLVGREELGHRPAGAREDGAGPSAD
jgi:hypothetical protein